MRNRNRAGRCIRRGPRQFRQRPMDYFLSGFVALAQLTSRSRLYEAQLYSSVDTAFLSSLPSLAPKFLHKIIICYLTCYAVPWIFPRCILQRRRVRTRYSLEGRCGTGRGQGGRPGFFVSSAHLICNIVRAPPTTPLGILLLESLLAYAHSALDDDGSPERAEDADLDLEAGNDVTGEKRLVVSSTDVDKNDAPGREAHLVLEGPYGGRRRMRAVLARWERHYAHAEPPRRLGWTMSAAPLLCRASRGASSPRLAPASLGCSKSGSLRRSRIRTERIARACGCRQRS
ncbi:hypothetical protein B0H12DRAFT_1163627 [Mycena haematopus]|nr:hypothetical protein B0H12DRAFT_1163627 [Mycena haematopus]